MTVRPPRSRRLAIALLTLGTLSATACGGGDDDGSSSATTVTGATDDLPPLESLGEDDLAALQAVYGPPLAELDLVVTRGGVVDFRDGNHLQLYVEPTTDAAANPPQVYLDRMLTSFQAIIPLLFDAYPDMDSFDLCQEPVPDPGAPTTGSGYDEPVTLLLLTREGYESVDDWGAATLEDRFAAAADDLGGHVSASAEVTALPTFPA